MLAGRWDKQLERFLLVQAGTKIIIVFPVPCFRCIVLQIVSKTLTMVCVMSAVNVMYFGF